MIASRTSQSLLAKNRRPSPPRRQSASEIARLKSRISLLTLSAARTDDWQAQIIRTMIAAAAAPQAQLPANPRRKKRPAAGAQDRKRKNDSNLASVMTALIRSRRADSVDRRCGTCEPGRARARF